jgi:predicted transcriptional regulator
MYPMFVPGPMMPELEEIPRLRKALGLTQTALARLSTVSQSTIVKIEKKQMNPSYDVVRRVMASLQAELKRQEKKALVDQIQTRKVQYIEAKLPLATAVEEMRRWKFSQMPVMHNGHPVGSISDKVINNLILSGKDPKDLARIRVDDVMEPAFPQVDAKAPVELAASLLRHYNAVLVTSKGDVTGIVTKSDLMKLL